MAIGTYPTFPYTLDDNVKLPRGWTETYKNEPVVRLQASIRYDKNAGFSDKTIHQEIAYKLGAEIVQKQLVKYNTVQDIMDNTEDIKATICCVRPGEQYVKQKDTAFIVDDVTFTEEELVDAVRMAFPEKFV